MVRLGVLVLLLVFHLVSVVESTAVYHHAPGAVLDPRVLARIGNTTYNLEVEDAPAKPQTRDPGFGRPPFTSSRLRLSSSTPVRVTLQCVSRPGSSPCSFDTKKVLRGVDFDAAIDRWVD